MIAFFDHVVPWSVERTTAICAPRIFALWSANRSNPSTRSWVAFGRTLTMLPIVPACVPGL
jgi:hypothetical protein